MEVVDAEHGDRAFALQVIGEQDERRALGELDGCDPRAHPVDRETNASAEDIFEDGEVGGDVAAGRVQEVQRQEKRPRHEKVSRSDSSGRTNLAASPGPRGIG
ncbi:MAG: hypothetical protein E6G58_04895 [Actinobacteria bacterium]|nr:MAG: hypothetical protein E6G58_04895 [Actinomycetota bacterium]